MRDSEHVTSYNNQGDLSMIENQQLFQNNDLVNGEIKLFHNVLDKGYRATQHILRNNQKIIQPIYSLDGRGFTGDEGLCISEVASDRSDN